MENRLSSCVNCGLQNDSEIPQYMKTYVKLAKDTKIITEKVFYPNQVLTRAEAVVLIEPSSEHSRRQKCGAFILR